MKNLLSLAATAVLAILATTSAFAQDDDVTLHSSRTNHTVNVRRDDGSVVKVYFLSYVTGCGSDGDISTEQLPMHFKFVLGESLDDLGGDNLGAAWLTTQAARQQALRALGLDPQQALASDTGASDPDWICAVHLSVSTDRTERGGSNNDHWGQASGNESTVTVTMSAEVVCFRFGGNGKSITVRPRDISHTFLLNKEVSINDNGQVLFHLLRIRPSSTERHESHTRSMRTILTPMEREISDSIAATLRDKILH